MKYYEGGKQTTHRLTVTHTGSQRSNLSFLMHDRLEQPDDVAHH